MIKRLSIENFRGIEKGEIEFGKITILTGPNNSGKSSIIYALLTMKNIVLNSNQSIDGFLNLGFLNLGGFKETVFLKKDSKNIDLCLEVSKDDLETRYVTSIGKINSKLSLIAEKPYVIPLSLDVSFPYPANSTTGYELKLENLGVINITWNGITPTINFQPTGTLDELKKREVNENISRQLNAPIDELRAIDFVPLRRGFIKPIYSSVPMQQQLLSDDELATLLATDRDLEGKVALYLEQIVDRRFSVRVPLGTANFNLQSRDSHTGFVCDLVNEGFGTNQLVTILTKSLRKEMRTICIEEIEIHLHPELMDKLVSVLIDITENEDKNFIITTHSEHIVLSLLNKIVKKKIKPEDVRIYYLFRDNKRIIIEKQEINDKGQIKGGLKGFYKTELKEVKDFFNIPEAE